MTAQVVIMAAGLGARLKELTRATPKALIEVAGRPLVAYALAFAQETGAEHRVVVGGFRYADVAMTVATVAPHAIVVENPQFTAGNLLSMLAARRALRSGGFLLMNTDHVYNPVIAELVATARERAESRAEIVAFCDFDRSLGADDMKVRLAPDGRVQAMAKTLTAWDCGYVGMTYVPSASREAYFAAAAEVRRAQGDSSHVEAILVELAGRGRAPTIADISGHGWLEIDEPHERAHAEAVLARERWWGPR